MHCIITNILGQSNWHDPRTYILLAIVLAALSIASVVGFILARREKIGVESALVHRFNHKLKVWGCSFRRFQIFYPNGVSAYFENVARHQQK